MDFVDTIFQNWEIIMFIFGAIFNLGYVYSSIKDHKVYMDKSISKINNEVDELKKQFTETKDDFADIRGDIKSINAKLDLIINNKIK